MCPGFTCLSLDLLSPLVFSCCAQTTLSLQSCAYEIHRNWLFFEPSVSSLWEFSLFGEELVKQINTILMLFTDVLVPVKLLDSSFNDINGGGRGGRRQ